MIKSIIIDSKKIVTICKYSDNEHFDNTHNTFRDNTELDVSDGYVQAVTHNENTKSIEITPETLIAEGRGAVKFN